jgi:Ca2+-transporting ATPase
VGLATVGAFVAWFLAGVGAEELGGVAAVVSRGLKSVGVDLSWDGHSAVTWTQLTHWESCPRGSSGFLGAAAGGETMWRGFSPARSYTTGGGPGGTASSVRFDHPCDYFSAGKAKASTLSLSVLVAIEMANAFNALSEDGSLFSRATPPWANPYVFAACAVSLGLHCLILYVPALADVFSIVPLSGSEWALVALLSLPVILLDELLKWLGREVFTPRTARERRSQHLAGLAAHARDAAEREERARVGREVGRRAAAESAAAVAQRGGKKQSPDGEAAGVATRSGARRRRAAAA